jgi:hypothetical protein
MLASDLELAKAVVDELLKRVRRQENREPEPEPRFNPEKISKNVDVKPPVSSIQIVSTSRRQLTNRPHQNQSSAI